MIWTAKSNVAPTDGAEAVVEVAQPKAGIDTRFARDNNTARDAFLKRVKKEIDGVEIKDITTPAKVNPIEKFIKLNGRVVAHLTNRPKVYFGIGLRTSEGNKILGLHNQKEVDSAFDELVKLCEETRHKAPKVKRTNNNKKSKNSKPTDSKLSDEEIIEGAKERIAKLGNGSKGIGMGKGDLTKGVVK